MENKQMISQERQREIEKIAKSMKPFLPPKVTCHKEFQTKGKPL